MLSAIGTHSDDETLLDSKPSKSSTVLELTDQTNILPFRKVAIIFLGLALCILTSVLDSVIVATALPTISAHFHAGSTVAWVPSAYLLTSTGFQPLYGRFSDIFGRKFTLCIAMSVFIIGSLAAGFSRTILELIVLRGFAGAGGGGIVTIGQVIISDVVSLRDRGKYQGIIGGVIAVGYALGPLIGGALAQKVSWRWCFWITLPVSLCAVPVIIFVLPLKPVQGDIRRKLLAVDYVGSFLTLMSCTLILLPLIWGGVSFPWTSAIVLATLLSGVFVAIIFCLWEWKVARLPIVPMHIFKHSTVIGVYISMFVNGFIFWSSLFYLPQFSQIILRFSPIHSGLFLLPILVSQVVTSTCAGIVVSRTGRYRVIIYSGFTIWTIACGLLSTLKPGVKPAVFVVYMLLAGIGAGQTLQTTVVAAQASVSRQDMSVVTAVRNFVRLLGGTLTLPIGSAIINNSLRHAMTSLSLPSATIDAIIDDPTIITGNSSLVAIPESFKATIIGGYVSGFKTLFILNAAFSALATIAGVLMIKHKELRRPDELKHLLEEKKTRGPDDIELGTVVPVPSVQPVTADKGENL